MRATSWDGYELDGSDTTFEVAVDDLARAREALAALLRHPLLDPARGVVIEANRAEWAPHRIGPLAESRRASTEVAADLACGGELDDHTLLFDARPPASLEPALLDAIARHSRSRDPFEPAYVLAKRPRFVGDGEYFSPSVSLTLHSARSRPHASAAPLAEQLLSPGPGLELTLGPTFIYEYAMELVETVSRADPEAIVTGGLDCANGWTWGCTYAASLYPVVALEVEMSADECLRRVLEAPLLGRPLLRDGYDATAWYKTTKLPSARDVNFVGRGKYLIAHLEAPAAIGLAPSLERFIDQGDQATLEQYALFCRDLRASPLDATAKRELSLVYLCLPTPDEVDQDWARELNHQQLELLRPLHAGSDSSWPNRLERTVASLSRRVCWFGLDDRDTTHSAFWVRPELALYAEGVFSHVARLRCATARPDAF